MKKSTTDPMSDKSSFEPFNRTVVDKCSVQPIMQQEFQNSATNSHWKSFLRSRSRWGIIVLVINLLILCLIVTLLIWYLEVVPRNQKYINTEENHDNNRKCQSLRLSMCLKYKVPYSYTLFPNAVGQKNQAEASKAINRYDPIISIKCYVLLPLFLCAIYAPKCNRDGQTISPCRSLCQETIRKCDFFLGVFGLSWPLDIDCSSLPESSDPDVCVGYQEKINLERNNEACTNSFRCDQTRCLPKTWLCDGYPDCEDKTDEKNCSQCMSGQYYCGNGNCVDSSAICDGIKDCNNGRDESQCLRLKPISDAENEGRLEIYSPDSKLWLPVCGTNWDSMLMSHRACNLLGYKQANETRLRDENETAKKRISSKMVNKKRPMKTIFSKAKQCTEDNVTVFLKCQSYECGKADVSVSRTWRIVGGKESSPGSWPWLAALHGGPDEVYFCGGVLLSSWWVLSAAHCVGNQTYLDGWTIKLGMTRRVSSPFFVQNRGVSLIVKHPDYKTHNHFNNDLVLLMLDKPVNFDQFLHPICLPPANLHLVGNTSCIVIGWGKSVHDDDADYQVVINEAIVPIVDFKTCVNWYSIHQVNISEQMVCAGYREGKKDACQGDSGGPLLCRDSNRWFVAGIVSWGIKCAQPNLPGIYTNIPLYVDWILATTASYGHSIQ